MDSGQAFNVTDKRQFDSYQFAFGDSQALKYKTNDPSFLKLLDNYEKQKEKQNIINILGISCTMVDKFKQPKFQRPSTSEYALDRALKMAVGAAEKNKFKEKIKCQTVMLKLRDLEIRNCEGYYSRDKKECNWPCVISGEKMDNPADKMDVIYWALGYWADIVFVATPVRYGNAGALYYKMVERLNSIHNELTLRQHHVIKDKVAAFIITGGQDGIQAVAGQLLTYWSEVGYNFSKYSYVGWSRGWYAENTKTNFPRMIRSRDFNKDLRKMVEFAIDMRLRLKNSPSLLKDDYETGRVNPLIKYDDRDLSEVELQKPIPPLQTEPQGGPSRS